MVYHLINTPVYLRIRLIEHSKNYKIFQLEEKSMKYLHEILTPKEDPRKCK